MKEFCRTCAEFFEESKLIPVFENIQITTTAKHEFQLIEELILLNIQMKENDGLSQQICIDCIQQLIKIHDFRKECERAQIKLKEYFEKNIDPEILAPSTSTLKNIHNETNSNNVEYTSTFDEVNHSLYLKSCVEDCLKDLKSKIALENRLSLEMRTKVTETYVGLNEPLISLNQNDYYDDGDESDENDETEISYKNNESYTNLKNEPSENLLISEIQNAEIKFVNSKIIQVCSKCNKYGYISRNKSDEKYCHNEPLKLESSFLEFYCSYCNEKFDTIKILETHIVKEHPLKTPYSCTQCNESFAGPNKRDKHLDEFHRINEHKCDLCSSTFSYKYRLIKHKKYAHPDGKRYECNICFKKCINLDKFKYHLKSHNPDDQYKCRFCDKRFNHSNHLKFHEETHTNIDNPYKCQECNETYVHRASLRTHITSKHKQIKPFICETCGEGFAAKYLLNSHISSVHEKKYFQLCQCEICGKMYKTRKVECCGQTITSYGMRTVQNTKNKKIKRTKPKIKEQIYNCLKCPRKFSVPHALEAHLKVHDENRKYSCEICTISFLKLSHFQSHINRVHSKSKVYTCPHCDKEFYDPSARSFHVKSVHLEPKKRCRFCGKDISFKYFRTHERTHTQEKKYTCAICDKIFDRPNALKWHYKTHTVQENEILKEKILKSNETSKE